jgi:DNA-binding response OmpR family regulator
MHNTILIVDDDESMRTFLSTVLQEAGYEVVLADSLQAGMQALEETPVDS